MLLHRHELNRVVSATRDARSISSMPTVVSRMTEIVELDVFATYTRFWAGLQTQSTGPSPTARVRINPLVAPSMIATVLLLSLAQ
jgi:hypothetical protein